MIGKIASMAKKGLSKLGNLLGIGVEIKALRIQHRNLSSRLMEISIKVRMRAQDISQMVSEIDSETNQLNDNLGDFIKSTKEKLTNLLVLTKNAVYSMRPARIEMLKKLGQIG